MHLHDDDVFRVCKTSTVGTPSNMNVEALFSILVLMGLLAVALTGAVWGTPIVTVPLRWFMS